ncbi:MAG: M20/M25/M40 family metallo-hydrolase [Chloroflexi bacterium]|nr:M20/M25/M40 family metallo-hydrolase [Chloroflexota bacterium]
MPGQPIAVSLPAPNLPAPVELDWPRATAEAAQILSQLLQYNTTNPPGNELFAAEFLAGILRNSGIACQVIPTAPCRANLFAHIPAHQPSQSPEPPQPLLLLGHLDVVYAAAAAWHYPPFGGVIAQESVWGRGALDMKGLLVMQIMALLLIHRQGQPLRRDLMFLAVADEESQSTYGLRWILENWEERLWPGYVINEGGCGISSEMGPLFLVASGEKGYCDVRVRATGRGGHAALPHSAQAIPRLARALARLEKYRAPLRLTATTRASLELIPPFQGGWERYLLRSGLTDSWLGSKLIDAFAPRALTYSLRNTFTASVLQAGEKSNVIPAEAEAILNCRVLPGISAEELLAELRMALGDAELELIADDFSSGNESPLDTSLYHQIVAVLQRNHPEARVIPYLLPATSDSRFFRARGVPTYGITPAFLSSTELESIHGDNERISLQNLEMGVRNLYHIVSIFCGFS